MSEISTAQAPAVPNLATTRKEVAAAKKAHPAGKAVEKAAAKKPAEKKAEPRQYEAKGRSGQVAVRTCAFKATHAVDVQRPGKKPAYAAGVIVRMFASKDAAEAFAALVNSGEMGKKDEWYREARNAIVVPAKLATQAKAS